MCATDIKALLKYKDNLKVPYETYERFYYHQKYFEWIDKLTIKP